MSIGIIVGCLPVLPRFFNQCLGRSSNPSKVVRSQNSQKPFAWSSRKLYFNTSSQSKASQLTSTKLSTMASSSGPDKDLFSKPTSMIASAGMFPSSLGRMTSFDEEEIRILEQGARDFVNSPQANRGGRMTNTNIHSQPNPGSWVPPEQWDCIDYTTHPIRHEYS